MADVQAKLKETINKLAKVRRQKKMLRTKGMEMVRRGLNTMDELEADDQQRLQQQQQQQQQQQHQHQAYYVAPPSSDTASTPQQTLEQALTTDGFYLDWASLSVPGNFPPGPSSGDASKSPFD